jgi:DNA-binding NtrC family response regulator
MSSKSRYGPGQPGEKAAGQKPGVVPNRIHYLMPKHVLDSSFTDPDALKFLEDIMDTIAFTYATFSLNSKPIPLKKFLNGFEKKFLLACLRRTAGNQKEAAAVMGIKPTALIEKMHKYGIRGRRAKLQ